MASKLTTVALSLSAGSAECCGSRAVDAAALAPVLGGGEKKKSVFKNNELRGFARVPAKISYLYHEPQRRLT